MTIGDPVTGTERYFVDPDNRVIDLQTTTCFCGKTDEQLCLHCKRKKYHILRSKERVQ